MLNCECEVNCLGMNLRLCMSSELFGDTARCQQEHAMLGIAHEVRLQGC